MSGLAPSVCDTADLLRGVMPEYGDAQDRYWWRIERDGGRVRVDLGLLLVSVSKRGWRDEALGCFHVGPDDDPVQVLAKRFPDLPRCDCGCGVYVPKTGDRHPTGSGPPSGTRGHYKEVCKWGHPMVGDNIRIRPSDGYRECRQCKRDRKKEEGRRKREAKKGLA